MKNSKLLIEYNCPQCGAPATIEETDHLFACAFCRVKSYLLSRVYHYVLPHRAPEGRELIYMPYWRFKGMLFSCGDTGMKHRLVDLSCRGVDALYAPVSLGLRSQTQKLRFLTPDTDGRFLKPDMSYSGMLKQIMERFGNTGRSPALLQSFIGETLSIIYAPFYLEGKLYDAVLNRPISPRLSDDRDLRDRPGGKPSWELRFVTAQCPDCGWDLEGERDSFALSCRNCQSLWHAGKSRFMKLHFASFTAEQHGISTLFLPFFKVRAKVNGIRLDSLADLIRMGNLPKAVLDSMEEEPFYFWVPAFKVRPDDFLKLSVRTTLGQPEGRMDSHLPVGEIYPVTLPLHEALESLKVSLASFMKPPRRLHPLLPGINIEPKDVTLIYIPFTVKGNEIFHAPFRLRLSRTTLAYGRVL